MKRRMCVSRCCCCSSFFSTLEFDPDTSSITENFTNPATNGNWIEYGDTPDYTNNRYNLAPATTPAGRLTTPPTDSIVYATSENIARNVSIEGITSFDVECDFYLDPPLWTTGFPPAYYLCSFVLGIFEAKAYSASPNEPTRVEGVHMQCQMIYLDNMLMTPSQLYAQNIVTDYTSGTKSNEYINTSTQSASHTINETYKIEMTLDSGTTWDIDFLVGGSSVHTMSKDFKNACALEVRIGGNAGDPLGYGDNLVTTIS